MSSLLRDRSATRRPVLALLVLLATFLQACEPEDGAMLVTVAGTTTPDTPGEATWLDFKRDVEAASGGAIRLRPLIYGQLGSEEQHWPACVAADPVANLSAQMVSTLVPELALLYAPYLFSDTAEADYVYDNYLTDIYRELLAEHDLHLITWYEIGLSQVYGRQPVILPADARGRRFRVSSALSARLFAESLGADVITLGYGEIVSALQTGLIVAGENSVSLYARTGIAGEAPHLTLTDHSFGVSVIVTELRWWHDLPEQERRILEEAFPPFSVTRKSARGGGRGPEQAGALGIVPHVLTDAQREQWRAATAPVTPRSSRRSVAFGGDTCGGDRGRARSIVLPAAEASAGPPFPSRLARCAPYLRRAFCSYREGATMRRTTMCLKAGAIRSACINSGDQCYGAAERGSRGASCDGSAVLSYLNGRRIFRVRPTVAVYSALRHSCRPISSSWSFKLGKGTIHSDCQLLCSNTGMPSAHAGDWAVIGAECNVHPLEWQQ